MRVVCIAQARMGSSRLPGKVLRTAGGLTLLEHLVRRLARCRRLDAVVIATTTAAADIDVEREALRLGVGVFRGSEQDVLARYHGAATEAAAEVVVRVTADCPLLDPAEVDRLVEHFTGAEGAVEYLSNQAGTLRQIPRGLDVEVFSMAVLDRAFRQAREPGDREHVTPYLYREPGRFRTEVSHWNRGDLSHLRVTVDTPEDLLLVQTVVDFLGNDAEIEAVAELLQNRPEIAAINASVRQKGVDSEDGLRRRRIGGRHLLGRGDGGPSIGFGHLARLEAILETWVELGGRATLRGVGVTGVLRERLLGAGVEIEDVDEGVLRLGDAIEDLEIEVSDHDATRAALARLGSVGIVVDGYHFGPNALAHFHEVAPLLMIDDLAAFEQVADVCLNQNMAFDPERYRTAAHTRLLVGHPFALFRREFREVTRAPREVAPARVVLSFGGSDPARLSAPLLRALLARDVEGVIFQLVLGGGVPSWVRDEVMGLVREHAERVQVLTDVPRMSDVLVGASVAVLAAGSTTWEAMRCGVWPLVIAVADNQRAVAAGVEELGAGTSLGFHGDLSPEDIAGQVVDLFVEGPRLDGLCRRAGAAVDGRGVYRAIDALLDAIDRRDG